MGFSKANREKAMVLAARRCCVCRRFKGVGVEVHHITPLARGGKNSLDNAIVLCFDCHCAAGHYNPRHPRGTKFNPGELRKHRDDWFQRVRDSGVNAPEPEEFSRYYSRHLLCTDTDAARDLLDMDREQIPFRYDYVLSNRVLDFMAPSLGRASQPIRLPADSEPPAAHPCSRMTSATAGRSGRSATRGFSETRRLDSTIPNDVWGRNDHRHLERVPIAAVR